MKRIALLIIYLCVMCSSIVEAQIKVTITDGIYKTNVKMKMEKSMSAFLSEVNSALADKRELRFDGLGLSSDVRESVSMLWENSPFECIGKNIQEHCLTTGTGYQIRNIPLAMRSADAIGSADEYQEAVFSFDKNGNMESFYLTLAQNLSGKVFNNCKEEQDLHRRQLILDYVEHFRTAYNQKDLKFLNQVFSEDALIITGKVIKQKTNDKVKMPDRIKYTPMTKLQYMDNLKRIFSNNKYIKVTFDEIEVLFHPTKENYYGVTLHQGWTSDIYHDDGYLFMLWDFTDEDAPQIHVRTWQPDKVNGKMLPREEIFGVGDFDF